MKSNSFQKVIHGAGLVVSIIMLIYGIILIFSSVPSPYVTYLTDYTFGADYYTESYAALRAISKNVSVAVATVAAFQQTVQHVGGAILIILGSLSALECCRYLPLGERAEKPEEMILKDLSIPSVPVSEIPNEQDQQENSKETDSQVKKESC